MSQREDGGFVPGKHSIDSYGSGGFRFAGMSHRGSIIATPSGVQAWKIEDPALINAAAFTGIFAEAISIDLLIVGTGEKSLGQEARFAEALRAAGLKVDVMDTASAARTYNLMLDEGRRVAAALVAVG
jgi:uncharacterized protein